MNSCNDCIFNNDGCELGLTDTIKSLYDYEYDTNGALSFDGSCFMQRPLDWCDENAKNKLRKELRIRPHIFTPISNIDELRSFQSNFKRAIIRSNHIGIIDSSEIDTFNIIHRFNNSRKIHVIKNLVPISYNDSIYQSLKTAPFARYVVVIHDPSTATIPKRMFKWMEHNINKKFIPITGIIGNGYYIISSILFNYLMYTGNDPLQILQDNLSTTSVFKDNEVN